MSWEMIGSLTAFSTVLAVAVWRFGRLEAAAKHQADCTRVLVRMVGRLNYRFRKHIAETTGGK